MPGVGIFREAALGSHKGTGRYPDVQANLPGVIPAGCRHPEQHKDSEITFIGVSRSPSCAARTTTVGYKGGMIKKVHEAKHEHIDGMGVFFEEIEKELEKRGIRARYRDA